MPLEPKRTEVEEEETVVVRKSTADLDAYVWVRGKVWGVVTGEADAGGEMDDTYQIEFSVTNSCH